MKSPIKFLSAFLLLSAIFCAKQLYSSAEELSGNSQPFGGNKTTTVRFVYSRYLNRDWLLVFLYSFLDSQSIQTRCKNT